MSSNKERLQDSLRDLTQTVGERLLSDSQGTEVERPLRIALETHREVAELMVHGIGRETYRETLIGLARASVWAHLLAFVCGRTSTEISSSFQTMVMAEAKEDIGTWVHTSYLLCLLLDWTHETAQDAISQMRPGRVFDTRDGFIEQLGYRSLFLLTLIDRIAYLLRDASFDLRVLDQLDAIITERKELVGPVGGTSPSPASRVYSTDLMKLILESRKTGTKKFDRRC